MSSKTQTGKKESHFSLVMEMPAAEPEIARQHFASRLAFESDIADLALDLQRGQNKFTIVDTRSPKSFEECRIPGAINLSKINKLTVADLPKDKVCIVYCWGPACNGSIKGAMKLAALGFRVKELTGGMEYWRKENCPVEGSLGEDAPMYWQLERTNW